jgi:phosphoribosyl 1,2-cyclic phosphodiesterase
LNFHCLENIIRRQYWAASRARVLWGAMRICFWGTRGSIAKPGPTTVKYGGNTSCVEVRSAAGTLVVLDCGTGAHGLGQELLRSGAFPLCGHILISHTHWDHIQGIPFFAPLFEAGNEWDIYAPGGVNGNLKETLTAQMQPTYFPVSLEQLSATIRYHDLIEGAFTVGDIRIVAQRLNHPISTLGYRLEADGVSVVYATDHEPHTWNAVIVGGSAGLRPQSLDPRDRRHRAFLAGADIVIHDAQYTEAEYPAQLGWGHSPVERVVDDALAAGAKRLALFHHDPLREDNALEQIVGAARQRVVNAGSQMEVYAAAEGVQVELPPQKPAVSA